jgi:hypothetical protein
VVPPAHPLASPRRGQRCELWLLCASDHPTAGRSPEEWREAFAEPPVERVIGVSGHASTEAIATALDARLVALPTVSGEASAVAAVTWAALERELEAASRRLLVVLEAAELGAVVGRALDLPADRGGALRVDPGCLVLLRDDPLGVVLRRSNVRAPERNAGSELPWSGGPAR